LRNYAIYLGVPPDEVMAAIPERRRRERKPAPAVRRVAPPIKINTPRSLWLIAAAAGGVLVLAALIWLGLSAPEQRASGGPAGGAANAPQGGAAAGTAGAILPPLATGAATAAPTQAPTPPAPTATPATGVNVELRTVDRSWIRATVDGRVVVEETYAAGQNLRWTGQQSVLLRVGNGAGVDVTVNGQRVGPLGQAGQIVDREFRRDAATPPAAPAAR
jgi:cytoskeletal protein RodZ